jgi:hypothetical protein
MVDVNMGAWGCTGLCLDKKSCKLVFEESKVFFFFGRHKSGTKRGAFQGQDIPGFEGFFHV